jgi:polysaccharide export outer membrane protein
LQLLVQVTRRGQTSMRSLSALQRDGGAGLELEPGDRVLVLQREQFFFAFGAVNRPGEHPLTMEDTTLARTLARVSGLADTRADSSAVFLYRRQAPPSLTPSNGTAAEPPRVIYRINLRDPRGFFLSGELRVQPDDVIYVGEAPVAEIAKVLQLVTGWMSVGRTVTGPF